MSFLKIELIFQSSFLGSQQNRASGPEISPYTLCFRTGMVISIPHQRGTFVTINEPTLMCSYYLKSIVYFRVHSWCHTFCDFEQMYDDMCPSLEYYTGRFYCSKNPVFLPLHPLVQLLESSDASFCFFQHVI